MLDLIKEYKMKAIKIFSMVAVALMMVACSSEEAALGNAPVAGRKVHFSATIAAPNSGASTRTTYTEVTASEDPDFGKIKVAWEQGDEIALIHNGTKDVVAVQTLNADGSATISGDITAGTDGEDVTIVYPAASVDAPASGAEPIDNATYNAKLYSQEGTLAYIQDNLDFCRASGTLKVSGTEATLSDNISLASSIAVFKFTTMDHDASATIDVNPLTITIGSQNYVITPASATSELYVALPAVSDQDVCLSGTVGSTTYIYSITDVSFEAGKYYQSVIRMEIPVTSVTLTSSELVLVVGEADVTLTATALPDDADDKTVTWTSDNLAVATVDATTDNAKGTVHAVAEGEAIITAQAGDKTATCVVTVKYPGLLDGKFSVSATKQVQFSKGNLQAEVAGDKFNDYDFTASSWMFAEHQWDYLGNADNSNMFYINKLVDLFGWVGSSALNNTYGLCKSGSNDTHYYGSTNEALKSDWGTVAITNGGKTSNYGWRTLTKDEWAYLFETRTTTSGIRYAKATVNGKSGVILLPDDWSTSYYALASTNTADATYTSNEINADDWTSAFEAHGAVFLPAAGCRQGTSLKYYPGDYGCYWSSTSDGINNAYQVFFDFSGLDSSSISNRYYGCSVRLVKDVE